MPLSFGKHEIEKSREQLIQELSELRSQLFEKTLELERIKLSNRGNLCQIREFSKNHEYFQKMADIAPVILWVTEPDGTCIYLNQSWYEFTGQLAESGLGAGWVDAIHPDDRDYVKQSFKIINIKREPFRLEYRLRRKDGEYRWAIDSGKPRWGSNGEFLGFIGSVIDITEQRSAENSFAHQNELMQKIFDKIPVLIIMRDPQLQHFTLNHHAESVLGWNAADANGFDFMCKMFPDAIYRADAIAYMRSQIPGWKEFRCTTKNGQSVPIEWANVQLSDDTMVGIGIDLRERRKAQEVLKESERKFRKMIEALPVAVYTTDAEGRITHYNPAAVELAGRVPEPGTSYWCVTWKLFYPDGRPMPHDTCPMAVAIKKRRMIRNVEGIAERPDGSRRWFQPYPTPLFDDKGQLVGGINVLVDITERKLAEEALRESEYRFRALFDNSNDAFLLTRPDGTIESANPAACAMWGLSEQEFCHLGRSGILDANDQRFVNALDVRQNKGRVQAAELTAIHKSGKRFPVELDSTILPGNPEQSFVILRDISERKRANEILRQSMKKYRALFEQSADGIYLHDLDGSILDANRAAVNQSGYAKYELLRLTVFDFLTIDYDRQRVLERWRQWKPEQPITVEVAHRRKDGTIYAAEVNTAKVQFGKEELILAIVRDITERKQTKETLLKMNENLERQVAERTAELERRNREIRELAHKTIAAMENDRKALSKELHDSVGGTLAAIKYQLESRVEDFGSPPHWIKLPLEKIITYLSDAITESRRITKQLRPSVLDDFGLSAAINEHIADFQDFHPKIKVKKRIRILDELSDDLKTILYRVLQEALNNVGKHSKANQVDIRCFRYRGWVKLIIKDNGVGFNSDEIIQHSNVLEGYGIHSMKERVEICKGRFHIESMPGKGTIIFATVPAK